jgi:hypothetical protein
MMMVMTSFVRNFIVHVLLIHDVVHFLFMHLLPVVTFSFDPDISKSVSPSLGDFTTEVTADSSTAATATGN